MRRSTVVPLALLLACGGGEADDGAPPAEPASGSAPVAEASVGGPSTVRSVEGVEVRLVGSIPWETGLASGEYRRVVISVGGTTDTLRDVAVEDLPTVAGDSTVHGFDRANGSIERGFVWRPGEGVSAVELPDDFLGFTASRLAPDASHLAYAGLARDAEAEGRRLKAVVRAWPSMETVAESGPVAGYPSDAMNSRVEWLSADSVEVRIRLDDLETQGGSWLRFRGTPSTGVFVADTVSDG